jgi:hypothetical protein
MTAEERFQRLLVISSRVAELEDRWDAPSSRELLAVIKALLHVIEPELRK